MNLNSMVLSLKDNPELKDALSKLSPGDTFRAEVTGMLNEQTDKQATVTIEEVEVIEDSEAPAEPSGEEGGAAEGESEGDGAAMLMMGKGPEEED